MFERIITRLEKLSDMTNAISKFVLGLIVLLMVSIIVLQVFMRYVLHSGFNWPEEVTTFLMAWMTFLGAAVAVKQSEHINLELFVKLLPPPVQRMVNMIAKTVCFLFFAFLIYFGYQFAVGSWSYKAMTLNLSLFWPRVSVFVCALLMALHMTVFILKEIRGGGRE